MFLILVTFVGFGNGTLVFSYPWVGVKGCGAPEALGLIVITNSPWRRISLQGPMWVEANNYSLKVITWILGGLIGGLNPFLKYAELLFSSQPRLQCHLSGRWVGGNDVLRLTYNM